MADLPNAVSTSLRGADYAGWTVAKVWHVKKDGKEFYKVKMKKGEEVHKVKMNADGTLIKRGEYHRDKAKDKSMVK